jgi:hypothetical protein
MPWRFSALASFTKQLLEKLGVKAGVWSGGEMEKAGAGGFDGKSGCEYVLQKI